MLKLRIVQAKFGDCLIIEYGSKNDPRHMLIDGGPASVFSDFLRAELMKIKSSGGQIDLLVLSHIDGDHIVGLLDLLEELKENAADEVETLIPIKELWVNSFSQTLSRDTNLGDAIQNMFANVNNVASTMPSANLVIQSVLQGDTLKRNAMVLKIPTNVKSQNEIISCETISKPIVLDNIKLTIVGPNKENLDKLKKEWLAWIKKNQANVMSTDPDVLAALDKSVPNLSSIMFMMESGGKRILFTGDGRGDFLLEGLEKVNMLDRDGNIHVDVFKLPHHGSVRNVPKGFFEKVTADVYVISADGRHDNPDYETLTALVTAAKDQGRKIKLICTNETPSTKKLLKKFDQADFGYEIEFMPKGDTSMVLTLIA